MYGSLQQYTIVMLVVIMLILIIIVIEATVMVMVATAAAVYRLCYGPTKIVEGSPTVSEDGHFNKQEEGQLSIQCHKDLRPNLLQELLK